MSMFSLFDISGSAMAAQSQRMNVTASNMANADSVAGPDGEQMPLLTPPGVRNVQRVLASVPAARSEGPRAPEGTQAGSRL